MGTGKTTIGERLAARLGWSFVDTDAVIAKREGRSIEAIFAADGEAYFRAREREVVAEVCRASDTVIATGGGAVLDDDNFRALREAATFVCLNATPEDILARTGGSDRPLLSGEREERIRTLLAARAGIYARIPHQIDTSALGIDQVVERILALHRAESAAGSRE